MDEERFPTPSRGGRLLTLWRLGLPGVDVPLTLARDGDVLRITVKSADRSDFLKKPNLH